MGIRPGSSLLEVISAFEKVSGQKLFYNIFSIMEGDVISVYTYMDKANTVCMESTIIT